MKHLGRQSVLSRRVPPFLNGLPLLELKVEVPMSTQTMRNASAASENVLAITRTARECWTTTQDVGPPREKHGEYSCIYFLTSSE